MIQRLKINGVRLELWRCSLTFLLKLEIYFAQKIIYVFVFSFRLVTESLKPPPKRNSSLESIIAPRKRERDANGSIELTNSKFLIYGILSSPSLFFIWSESDSELEQRSDGYS